jgi:hypothetical protein
VYHLPFDQIEQNVRTFLEVSPDPHRLCIVLVDHDRDRARVEEVRAYWRSVGVERFRELDLINRGGTLQHTHADYATHPQADAARRRLAPDDALCVAPSLFPFVAYDGRYLLCGSDWQRKVILPTVFERSIFEVLHDKYLELRAGNEVCAGCNHHPHNRVADMLADVDAGTATADDLDGLLEHLREASGMVRRGAEGVERVGGVGTAVPAASSAVGRRIPVRAL